MERNDIGWKLFTFGMNDVNGRLIEIKMPARDYYEAVRNVKCLIFMERPADHPLNKFWLNDEEDYL